MFNNGPHNKFLNVVLENLVTCSFLWRVAMTPFTGISSTITPSPANTADPTMLYSMYTAITI